MARLGQKRDSMPSCAPSAIAVISGIPSSTESVAPTAQRAASVRRRPVAPSIGPESVTPADGRLDCRSPRACCPARILSCGQVRTQSAARLDDHHQPRRRHQSGAGPGHTDSASSSIRSSHSWGDRDIVRGARADVPHHASDSAPRRNQRVEIAGPGGAEAAAARFSRVGNNATGGRVSRASGPRGTIRLNRHAQGKGHPPPPL